MRSAFAIVSFLLLPLPAAAEAEPVRTGVLLFSRGSGPAAPTRALALRTDIEAKVSGLIARVTVKQKFKNPSAHPQNATYAFPLPDGAAVDGLKMQIGARVVEGVVQKKADARAAFENAKRQGQRATLVEQASSNLFTTEVANIDGNATVIVALTYQWHLTPDNGTVRARFPLAFTPRYTPDTQPNTLPPGAMVQHPVTFRAEVAPGFRIASIKSLYHPMTPRALDEGVAPAYALTLEDDEIPADRDLVIQWKKGLYERPEAAVFAERYKDETYRLILLTPPAHPASAHRHLPRDVVFILDSSGSMFGESMDFARAALQLAIAQLDSRDRFDIVDFDSTYRPLFAQPTPASAEAKRAAGRFIQGVKADGGTEMKAPLAFALGEVATTERFAQVVFITDGAISNEADLEAVVDGKLGRTRLFTVGIGRAPNTFFMRKMAERGRGTFVYVGAADEVRGKMGALFAKMSAPVLTDIEVAIDGATDVFPRRIPDLYIGEPILVGVRGGRLDAGIILSGRFGREAFVLEVKPPPDAVHAGVHQVVAHKQVASLLDGTSHGTIPDVVQQRIEHLGVHHHIITPYTSLVAVDKTGPRTALAPVASAGELPRGGTASRLLLLLGALFLALGLGLRRRRDDALDGAAA